MLIIVIIIIILLGVILDVRVYLGAVQQFDEKKYRKQINDMVSIADTDALLDNQFTDEIIKTADICRTYDEIPHELKYVRTTYVARMCGHIGQLKLLLSEIEFLTLCLKNKHDKSVVVYAGSSPSNKLSVLADHFPNVKFILVDPNEHLVMYGDEDQYNDKYIGQFLYFVVAEGNRYKLSNRKVNLYNDGVKLVNRHGHKFGIIPNQIAEVVNKTDYKYYLVEDYMTNELATQLSGLHGPIYFISDIRTKSDDEKLPSDLHLLWNSAQNYNWIKRLKPQQYMLKFRPPYEITTTKVHETRISYKNTPYMHRDFELCDIPLLENYSNKKYSFLDGKVYTQAYAGLTSTEGRLIGSTLNVVEYDCVIYENKFFYYNQIHRPYGFHDTIIDKKIGLDRCGDCARMCQIIGDYKRKYNIPATRNDIVNSIQVALKQFRRSLFINFHGNYLYNYNSKLSTRANAVIISFDYKLKSTDVRYNYISSAKILEITKILLDEVNPADANLTKAIYMACKIVPLGSMECISIALSIYVSPVEVKYIMNKLTKKLSNKKSIQPVFVKIENRTISANNQNKEFIIPQCYYLPLEPKFEHYVAMYQLNSVLDKRSGYSGASHDVFTPEASDKIISLLNSYNKKIITIEHSEMLSLCKLHSDKFTNSFIDLYLISNDKKYSIDLINSDCVVYIYTATTTCNSIIANEIIGLYPNISLVTVGTTTKNAMAYMYGKHFEIIESDIQAFVKRDCTPATQTLTLLKHN